MLAKIKTYNSQNYAGTLVSGLIILAKWARIRVILSNRTF